MARAVPEPASEDSRLRRDSLLHETLGAALSERSLLLLRIEEGLAQSFQLSILVGRAVEEGSRKKTGVVLSDLLR